MKRIALIDCNNFFVSCEKVFNPKLHGKPVVVLSSNDACVIARSNEAKKIGIKMGQAAFECKDLFNRYQVIVYSSNFPLYGDMSARVMKTISDHAADIEIYSVDEAFVQFPERFSPFESVEEELEYYTNIGHFVRADVLQKTGIPTSIGFGRTKTLAKIANHIAKKNPLYKGVCDLTDHPDLDEILKKFAVADVWGVGYRYAKLLDRFGIKNAYQLKQSNDAWIRKNMTINGLKTVLELRGIPCLELEDIPNDKKSLTVSRAFGRNVTDINDLNEAIAFHATTAAEKLRKQKTIAKMVTVFVCCTTYQDTERFYDSHSLQLPHATSFTPDIIAATHRCIKQLYKRNLIYKKVGILLDDFYTADTVQMSTFAQLPDLEKQATLMSAIDMINKKMGRNTVFFAAAGVEHDWQTKRAKKSPSYTTNWNELLTIKI